MQNWEISTSKLRGQNELVGERNKGWTVFLASGKEVRARTEARKQGGTLASLDSLEQTRKKGGCPKRGKSVKTAVGLIDSHWGEAELNTQ